MTITNDDRPGQANMNKFPGQNNRGQPLAG